MNIYRFPLKQHVGKEAVPSVAAGDSVTRGQLLAYPAEEALSVPIHSSVSGIVTEVNEIEIVIQANDAQSDAYLPIRAATPLDAIKEAGIVGLGGAGFPTYVKLSSPIEGGTVLVNAAECEPILCHNMARIRQSAKEILKGLEIVMSLVKAKEGIIAIKEIHKEEISLLEKINASEHIRLTLLPNLYPMGEERAIVREALGELLPPDALPSKANALVINVETLFRIYEAVELKKPLIDKDLTIAGKIKGNHQKDLIQVFLDEPLGIATASLFEKAGGVSEGYGELIAGGPFTGKRTTMDAPLVKTTGGIIATECFLPAPEKIGLLVCACGAGEERLRQIAASMGSEVTGVEFCKQARNVRGNLKCENPGRCPGQVQKVMALKKSGAQAVLISNCTDCSNTVMSCAPKLGLPVYHCTDQALRAVNIPLIRKMK